MNNGHSLIANHNNKAWNSYELYTVDDVVDRFSKTTEVERREKAQIADVKRHYRWHAFLKLYRINVALQVLYTGRKLNKAL